MSIFQHLRDKNEANLFIAAAGAGSGLQMRAFGVPGASAYLVGCAFPYSTREFDKFIGHKLDKYCSEQGAIELAMAAFIRAKQDCAHDLSVKPKKSIGLGLSCAVTSSRARKGSNRIHAAIVSDYGCYVVTKNLSPHEHEYPEDYRCEEDEQADDIGEGLIEYLFAEKLNSPDPGEIDEKTLMSKILANPVFMANGTRLKKLPEDSAILLYPGSFNPAHPGHLATILAGEHESVGMATPYITIDHPDKGRITAIDVLTRIAYLKVQIPDRNVMISEGDPLYVDKAKRFPDNEILVGSDTLKRMADPKYGLTADEVDDKLEQYNVQLICVPRTKEDYEDRTYEINAYFSDKVSPAISSTQIRENWSKQ